MRFILGEEYARESLLEYVGSKQARSGIIWGKKKKDTIICTSGGRHSKRAGYQDSPNEDGTWLYFGQGEKGDQDPESYANHLLVEGQR